MAQMMTDGSFYAGRVSATSMTSQLTVGIGLQGSSIFFFIRSTPFISFNLQVFRCVLIQTSQLPRKVHSLARHLTIVSLTKLAAVRSGCFTWKGCEHSWQSWVMMHRSQKVCPHRCRRIGLRMTILQTPQMRYFVKESYQKVKSPQYRARFRSLSLLIQMGRGDLEMCMGMARFYIIQLSSQMKQK